MWVRNTSRYPADEVEKLVRYAADWLRGPRVCVNVKNLGPGRGSFRGRAYAGVPKISNAPRGATHLVTIGLGPPHSFAGEPWRGTARSPEVVIEGWREALVYVAAHEAMHVEQFVRRLRRSEIECNRFAAAALDRWRRGIPL
jgi:hypothetical protein